LQGCLIDIRITKVNTSTNIYININKWSIFQRILLPLQVVIKVESIRGVEIHQFFFQEPYKHTVSHQIELGWENSFTIRQFCSTLKWFYHIRSSMIIESRMENQETILQARERDKYFITMLWGQSILKGGTLVIYLVYYISYHLIICFRFVII